MQGTPSFLDCGLHETEDCTRCIVLQYPLPGILGITKANVTNDTLV